MKQILFRTALLGLFIALLSPAASACVLKIESEQDAPKAGTEDIVTVQFIQIHRNCPLKPEATEFKTEGIKILDESEWISVRQNVYECTVKVQYKEKGTAVFKAERSCPKKGGKSDALEIEVQ